MIAFINSFLSYIVLMLIILAVATLGFAIGMFLRKRKNANLTGSTDEALVAQTTEINDSETQENK